MESKLVAEGRLEVGTETGVTDCEPRSQSLRSGVKNFELLNFRYRYFGVLGPKTL